MNARIGAVAPALIACSLAAGLVLSGCTSSTPARPRRSATTARSTPGSPPAAPSSALSTTLPSGTPIAATTLGAQLRRGVGSITSAHLSLVVTVGTVAVTSAGEETVHDGRLEAIRLASTLPSGDDFEIRVLNGKTYAKLPASQYRTKLPWVLIAASSPSAQIRALSTSIDASLGSASLSNASAYLAAARSVRRVGPAAVGGVSTTRYGLVVDVSRLPSTFPGRASLASVGVKDVPVQLYLDGSGRPVRVTETVQVLGQATSAVATLTAVNQPVSITAPPADQVGTS